MGASSFTAIQEREVIVCKTNVFIHPYAVQQKDVFKNPHSSERFRTDGGSGYRFPRIRVGGRPNRKKSLRFQTKTGYVWTKLYMTR